MKRRRRKVLRVKDRRGLRSLLRLVHATANRYLRMAIKQGDAGMRVDISKRGMFVEYEFMAETSNGFAVDDGSFDCAGKSVAMVARMTCTRLSKFLKSLPPEVSKMAL
jgi:hypothetical protein